MGLIYFLARRFYASASHDKKRKATGLAIRIATIGVAIGLAVMLVAIAVVKGYQREVRSKLTGFTSHLEILDIRSLSSPESFPIAISDTLTAALKGIPEIARTERVSQKMGILKTEEAFHAIVLKGVDAHYDLSFIRSQLVEGRMPAFGTEAGRNEVLISRMQAKELGLKVGSRVYTYFIADDIKLRRFTVTGIYETNLEQFDDYFVWSDLQTVNRLNGWNKDQCSTIEVYARDFNEVDHLQVSVGTLVNGKTDRYGVPYNSMSVKENPRTASVVQWLYLLDFNVWVIFALMAGVAGFTMISGLLILILERTRTIGVLKALGASNTRIRHAFIYYAAFIVLRGLLYGNIVGLGIIAIQQYWQVIRLDPAKYYVTAAPVSFEPLWIIGINVVTLLICVAALIVPSFVISRIRPAKAIRFE